MRPDQARDLSEIFDDENIGSAIAKIRKIPPKQSQASFAGALGITREQLAFVETGRTPITTELGWLICKKFNIHPAWLMSGGVEKIPPQFDSIPSQKIAVLEKPLSRNGKTLFRQFWRLLGTHVMENTCYAIILKNKNEALLDMRKLSQDDPDVKVIRSLPELLSQLRKLTKDRGAKIALANEMRVSRQAVDQWLSEATKPTAEMTFDLISWVENQLKRTK